MDYPWKTKKDFNRRFPKGFNGHSDEEMRTIHIISPDRKIQSSYDFIDNDNWTPEEMITHLLGETDSEWMIETYSSEGISYERNSKGLWDLIEWGDPGGSDFFYYSPEEGLMEEGA